MNIEFLIQNINNGRTFDIGELASNIEWSTDVDFQPGKFTFNLLQHNDVSVSEGDIIRFKFEGRNIFYGRVFKKAKSEGLWSITAYDRLRYLQNTDTVVFGALPSHEVFTHICRLNNLPFRIVNASRYSCTPAIQDKKSYFAMIQDALDQTLVNHGLWYIIRDNFGTLEHISLNSLITSLVIGDLSMATSYSYESSIDDSYNVVKLSMENKETNKREVYLVRDSSLETKWGKLQYHESVNGDLNPAQIASQANKMLQALKVVNKTFRIDCLGVKEISAGSGIVLQFKDLESEGLGKPKLAIVSKCTHSWGKTHEMSIDLKVV
ncbi:hypothetical protein SAMN04488134_101771 [Amphibacillus marinus]|uniref:YqbQ/XkdQ domain-containing protein n=1 Tax=Amphibacillus marinus TaxID=872970 RepID=A0A1H8IY29_9BACI|nr:hypothetical protein [Amphibacillus marinus]SEN73514.1 hypothetical protein SAMN04488134_101771 [Amphibacillus marinus]